MFYLDEKSQIYAEPIYENPGRPRAYSYDEEASIAMYRAQKEEYFPVISGLDIRRSRKDREIKWRSTIVWALQMVFLVIILLWMVTGLTIHYAKVDPFVPCIISGTLTVFLVCSFFWPGQIKKNDISEDEIHGTCEWKACEIKVPKPLHVNRRTDRKGPFPD